MTDVTAPASQADSANENQWAADRTGDFDLQDRQSLRRVAGLSTELQDITEVEYRQLRLERVVLAGLDLTGDARETDNAMRELAALADTAGSQVLDAVTQRRSHPDPATYLGSGKARELAQIVKATGADTVICNDELAPSQRRALEEVVKVKVVDRIALILDIFAQHAKSREGKAQVELAQLQYLLPRLRGWGDSMSRQAGGRVGADGAGIGGRGPGETKLELDRRRINQRVSKLRREIGAMKTGRDTKRSARRRNDVPAVVIAGYTNAGKSTLLNRITGAGVLVENALFATLDPTVRRATTSDGREYTLSDTVGFVRQLPHQLVEAFRSSLEEVESADVLIHVVDGSHPDPEGQISAVREVLSQVGALNVPELMVINKADAADRDQLDRLERALPGCVSVSARSGDGIEVLLAAIETALPRPQVEFDVLIPYDHGEIVARLHDEADIASTTYLPDGTAMTGRAFPSVAASLVRFAR